MSRSSPLPGRNALRARLGAGLFALAAAATASAAQVSVLGLPHLASLAPAPTAEQQDVLRDRVARFQPSLICVEALPGERVAQFAREPQAYGELLQTFALDATRLAGEQQLRLRLDARQAEAAALQAAASAPADDAARLRLLALQLAAHDPWSAALNWSLLAADKRAGAEDQLGAIAPARLDRLLASANEISSLAIPLARALGHRRLCSVDPFFDELAVQPLESGLMPLLQAPGVMPGVQAWQAEVAAQWHPDRSDGLLALVRWHNGDAFAGKDRAAQWTIFDAASEGDAGRRRLMLWHARNAEISAHLYRALAAADGQRVLLLIGAAHRPFIDAALRAQPWIELQPARDYLGR